MSISERYKCTITSKLYGQIAETKMEYYKGSVEREEKLKIKVASMEEESDKLSRALQASEER